MATMRILHPTAKQVATPQTLTPFAADNRRIGILHNHSPHFDRLDDALPEALKKQL